MSRSLNILTASILLVAHGLGQVREKSAPRVTEPLLKSAGTPRYALLNINNLTTWHRHDGHSNHSPGADNGLYFPRGTANVIYQDCLIWGGKAYNRSDFSGDTINGQRVRVGGGTYGVGTRAGPVTGFGETAMPMDPNHPDVRIFRIRRDWFEMTDDELRTDAAGVYEKAENAVTQVQINAVRAQYEKDWLEWPVTNGAPFIDRNGNGIYDPPPQFNTDLSAVTVFTVDSLIAQRRDEPGIAGVDHYLPADQVLWTVYNDLNESDARSFEGSYPLGLEIQKTVWGYKEIDRLRDVYFVRFVFVNKGGVDTSNVGGAQLGSFHIDSFFVCYWSDPDLGSFSDDLAGVDTNLSLMFSYNGRSVDGTFKVFGLAPATVGYSLLGGFSVPSPNDSSITGFRYRPGFINQRLRSFQQWGAGDPYSDPPGGSSNYAAGTGRWWKVLRGFATLGTMYTADQYVAYPSFTGPTLLTHTGDPVTGTGWIDGLGTNWSFPPGDRRMMMSTGPAQLAPGDTSELVYAVGGGLGADRLTSITMLRHTMRSVHRFYRNLLSSAQPPAPAITTTTEMDGKVLLKWESASTTADRIDLPVNEYLFEGFVVYQLPDTDTEPKDGRVLQTIDRANGIRTITVASVDTPSGVLINVPTFFGSDIGLRHFAIIQKDSLGLSLENGTEYAFALTSYARSTNPNDEPQAVESRPVIFSVVPGQPTEMRLPSLAGAVLPVVHASGTGTSRIIPLVIDPSDGTGDTYEVRFDTSTGVQTLSVFNMTKGTTLFEDWPNPTHPDRYREIEGGIYLMIENAGGTQSGPGDVYHYTVAAPVRGVSVERENVARLTVFPNPVYKYDVEAATFLNLPRRASIRIYNLGGQLVRKFEKDDELTYLRWDLTNEGFWLVASGIYLCHIEMPDIGETKVLKLAVIQGQPWE